MTGAVPDRRQDQRACDVRYEWAVRAVWDDSGEEILTRDNEVSARYMANYWNERATQGKAVVTCTVLRRRVITEGWQPAHAAVSPVPGQRCLCGHAPHEGRCEQSWGAIRCPCEKSSVPVSGQQREAVARFLRDKIRQPKGTWDDVPNGAVRDYWLAKADELLALLAATRDGEQA